MEERLKTFFDQSKPITWRRRVAHKPEKMLFCALIGQVLKEKDNLTYEESLKALRDLLIARKHSGFASGDYEQIFNEFY